MRLIATIAWRNLFRHKGKSLIIGAILFLGALLMTAGNGVISGMDAGLQRNIVEGFCGDALLVSDQQESDNVFLEMMGKPVAPINNYKAIDSALHGMPAVAKWLPMGKNFVLALNEDGGMADGLFALGVDYDRYRAFFGDNLRLVQGAFPQQGGPFVLIPTGWRKQMGEFYGVLYTPEGQPPDTATLSPAIRKRLSEMSLRQSAVYMGMNADNSTTDVRVPVKAVVKYRSLNTIWGNFPIIDIESYRQCLGYFSAAAQTATVKQSNLDLFAASDASLDDLFGATDLVASHGGGRPAAVLGAGSLAGGREMARPAVDLDAGTYNMVLLRLRGSRVLDQAVRSLNRELEARRLGVRAVTWKKATGMIGSMAVLIKGALFVFVSFLFLIAIIIIINTLSMAAIERTPEIGMMRAVGARKGFIRWMFTAETGVLAAVFGGAGIVAGVAAVEVVATLRITSENDMVQLLFGGDTFRPLLTAPDIVLAVLQLALVTLLAVIYPLRVAGNITPLDAVSRD
ncbi:MAG: FtsX-like permease family protein [Candidatus Edwardsbacteria bacterium]|jgi:putative ABC transport system permease protein|nr:FtsX-like permease family protein [Candidatus Edwardsbacteria bacterium]